MRFAKGIVAAGLALGALALGTAANAQTFTIAQWAIGPFTPLSAGFQYNNNGLSGANAAGSFAITNVPVDFQFTVNNGYGARLQHINAILTLTGTTDAAATNSSGTITQTFTNITASFQIDSADGQALGIGGHSNLLTINFGSSVQGTLTGSSSSATFTSGITAPGATNSPPGLTGFSSDFLDFGDPNSAGQYFKNEAFSFSFSGLNNDGNGTTTGASSGAGPSIASNGVMGSWAADSVAGNASTNPIPPSLTPTPATPGETSALIGMGVAGAQFGMVRFRRRRAAKKAARVA